VASNDLILHDLQAKHRFFISVNTITC